MNVEEFEISETSQWTFNQSSNEAIKDVEEEVKVPDYVNGNGEIPVAKDMETGEIVTLPYKGTTRVFICAKSGQKKTILGKAYLSRIQKMGGYIFAGTDIKNDFSSWNGVQGPGQGASQSLQRVTQGLLKGEETVDLPRNLGIPKYLVKEYSSNPSGYATVFSMDFGDISEQDFKFLIDFEDWRSDTKQEILENILLDLDEDEDITWTYLEDRLEKEGSSGEKVIRKIRKFKDKNIISSSGESLESFLDFDSVNLCSLGLKGVDSYTLGSMKTIRFTSAICHRKVLEMRQNKQIDMTQPLVIFDDECHEVFPSDEASPAKDEMALVFSRRGRQAGVVSVLSTQRPSKVPSPQDSSKHDFISQTSHAFLGKGLSWKGYRTVFQAFRIYDSNRTQPLRDLKDELDDGQFLYIDENMDDISQIRIVEPLSPLTPHPEDDKN